MKEYIERAALKRELAPYEENDFSQQMDVILAIVDAQPAADVAPVVYVEWLCAETDDEQFFLCSVCNDKEYWESNYCPECGAKMYEEQEEPTNGKQHDAE